MTINAAKLRELAEFVRTNDCMIFNMGDWFTRWDKSAPEMLAAAANYAAKTTDEGLPENFCGTAGCLAGSYCLMAYGADRTEELSRSSSFRVQMTACAELGLSETARRHLFTPAETFLRVYYLDITREKAARACEVMADHPDKAEDHDFWQDFWTEDEE